MYLAYCRLSCSNMYRKLDSKNYKELILANNFMSTFSKSHMERYRQQHKVTSGNPTSSYFHINRHTTFPHSVPFSRIIKPHTLFGKLVHCTIDADVWTSSSFHRSLQSHINSHVNVFPMHLLMLDTSETQYPYYKYRWAEISDKEVIVPKLFPAGHRVPSTVAISTSTTISAAATITTSARLLSSKPFRLIPPPLPLLPTEKEQSNIDIIAAYRLPHPPASSPPPPAPISPPITSVPIVNPFKIPQPIPSTSAPLSHSPPSPTLPPPDKQQRIEKPMSCVDMIAAHLLPSLPPPPPQPIPSTSASTSFLSHLHSQPIPSTSASTSFLSHLHSPSSSSTFRSSTRPPATSVPLFFQRTKFTTAQDKAICLFAAKHIFFLKNRTIYEKMCREVDVLKTCKSLGIWRRLLTVIKNNSVSLYVGAETAKKVAQATENQT